MHAASDNLSIFSGALRSIGCEKYALRGKPLTVAATIIAPVQVKALARARTDELDQSVRALMAAPST